MLLRGIPAAKDLAMTNSTAGAETHTAQEPLGTLLVKRGLITQEQLEVALADQKASGEPLGKIVVARGYATPATVAQALATQHGGLLKTEYGFATGFGSALQPPATVVAAPPVSATVAAPAPVAAPPAVASPPAPTDTLRSELAHASAETERLRDDNERLTHLRAELEQRLASESQRVSSLERELETARESGGSNDELDVRIKQLEAEVAARDAAIEDFKETGEGWKKALAERDDAIRQLVEARDNALLRLQETETNAEPPARLHELEEELEAKNAAVAELTLAKDDALRRLRQAEAGSQSNDEALVRVRAVEEELEARNRTIAELTAARDEAVAELRALQADLASGSGAVDELTSARDDALAQLRAAKADLAQRDAERAAALQELEVTKSELAAREETLAANEVALAGREAAIADLVEKLETSLAERESPAPVPAADRWAGVERHLLFFQGDDGYELVERSGPPPGAGDTVQVPGGAQRVMKVGRAPAPGTPLPCAYLVAG
jgi:hypothetical protein